MWLGRAFSPLLVSLFTLVPTIGSVADPSLASMRMPLKQQAAERPTQGLLNELVTWLAENVELPAIYEHPRLEIVPALEIAFMRYGAFTDAKRRQVLTSMHNGSTADRSLREVLAIYSDASKTIFLAEGWTGRTTAEMSVLVHEMVHHLQRAAGLVYACPAEREKLAYEAQEKWLSQFGTSLAAEFDLDPFSLLAMTRCIH